MSAAAVAPAAKVQAQVSAEETQRKIQEAQAKALAKVVANAERYPHAMVGANAKKAGIPCTLQWDSGFQKYKCQIKCAKSGVIGRWVFTSDLFQVSMSQEEAAKVKKAIKAAAKAQTDAAKAAIKNGQVSGLETKATPSAK